MSQGKPEAVAGRFITVCLAGDWAMALDRLVPKSREAILSWGEGSLCSQISTSAGSAVLVAYKWAGNTDYVTIDWPAQDRDMVFEYQLLLTEVDGSWLIFDDHKIRQRSSQVSINPVPAILSPNIILTQAMGSRE